MPKTGGSGRNQRNNPYQLEELFIKFHRTPAGIAWRWRTELATLAFTAAALRWLDTWTTLTWAAIILAGLLAVTFAVPHSRRFITRRAWCVLARHRLQRLCYEARLHTRSGRLPLILWTRPTRVGERTWVLCRAGICAEDFDAHIGELQGRLLRPRRAGHPQPPVVPPDHHRHHPPRHPRGQPAHQLPAGAADRALPHRPARTGPPAGLSPRRGRARRITRHGGPRRHRGPPAPHLKETPAMTATDTRPLPPVPTFPFSMFDPVHLGRDEYGAHVHVNLAERNMLLGGEPGAGKSSGLNLITAHGALSHDCKLILVDGKQVELGLWRACADMFIGPSIKDAIAAFEAFQAIMNARYDDLTAAGRRKITRESGECVYLIVIDEYAYFSATVGTKQAAGDLRRARPATW